MAKSTVSKAEKNEMKERALKWLRENLKPGTTIYTAVKKISASRMNRQISMYIVHKGKIMDIGWYAAHAMDYQRADNGALKVGGTGMDMGFHIVYSLGRKVFPEGFKLAKGQHGRNGDTSGFDKNGGYAFTHEWI